MIYKIVLYQETPSIQEIAELSYQERATLIWELTNRYPGYGTESLDEELEKIINQGKILLNIQKDYSASIFTPLMLLFMKPSQEGENSMCPYGFSYYPKEITDLESFFTIKDDNTEYLLPLKN